MNRLFRYASKRNALCLIAASGTLGIALKFPTFFNQWVYFPAFPNILDSAFLAAGTLLLCYFALRKPQT